MRRRSDRTFDEFEENCIRIHLRDLELKKFRIGVSFGDISVEPNGLVRIEVIYDVYETSLYYSIDLIDSIVRFEFRFTPFNNRIRFDYLPIKRYLIDYESNA